MRRNVALTGQAASADPKPSTSIASLVFVAVLGAAFWIGALWATQPWQP